MLAALAPPRMDLLLRLPTPAAPPPSLLLNNPLLPSSFSVSLYPALASTPPRLSHLAAHARRPVSALASPSPLPPSPPPPPSSALGSAPSTKWLVVVEKPPDGRSSRSEVVDYYVETLAKVLGSEKEAQMCIYDASWQDHYGFCCDIDEDASREIASLPGVLSVRPDLYPESEKKDYGYSNFLLASLSKSDVRASKFSSSGENCEYWLVRMEKPAIEVVTKAQMVDHYAQILTKVMGNEKDAQVSMYHISWEKDFGFCCRIDEECARELADVPGVLSVQPDVDFQSDIKNYKGDGELHSKNLSDSSESNQIADIKTKRLFVTGLSFYTSEKTLRAAFEPFGELVEVKIIMDKISKRSKGYAFIEYTTEEAGGAALKEMNGKIINGWMIVVDVAKTNPPKYGRGRPRPSTSSASLY